MKEKVVFYSEADDPEMVKAFHKAQETFPYFWRELYWEYRRIVPALDLACVKIAFMQYVPGRATPVVEHMWVNDVEFDGDTIRGVLINDPNELTSVKNGDAIAVPLSQVSDWLFSSLGNTYGGFTIQQLLLKSGADRNIKTNSGKTALDFAKQLGWKHIVPVLEA